jgi:hypothetical protein
LKGQRECHFHGASVHPDDSMRRRGRAGSGARGGRPGAQGSSSASSRRTTFMSSHTSFLAPGFRSR